MGLFSRIRDRFRRKSVTAVDPRLVEIREETEDIHAEPDLIDVIWHEVDEMPVDQQASFVLDNNAAELFRVGWMEGDSGDDVVNARNEFFDLMEAYDISRDEFDWDAWRDWYSGD